MGLRAAWTANIVIPLNPPLKSMTPGWTQTHSAFLVKISVLLLFTYRDDVFICQEDVTLPSVQLGACKGVLLLTISLHVWVFWQWYSPSSHLRPRSLSDSLDALQSYVRLKICTVELQQQLFLQRLRKGGREKRRERECIPDGFLISAFGQDLIPSLSSSPLLVKPSTYHTGFLILSREPMPRQQH